MSEENIKLDLALAATRPPGGLIKFEPGEQTVVPDVLVQSPSTSHLKTWRPALTPSVATPCVATPIRTPSWSPKRAASSKPGPSKYVRHTLDDSRSPRRGSADSQTTEFLCGSEGDSDVFSSGDDDGPPEGPVNRWFVARKLRELAVLEEERQTEAVEAFLIDADIATEELAKDESVEDVRESANVGDVSGPEYSFSWSDDFSLFSGQEEEYTRNPGPTTSCDPNPLDIFNLIWDLDILTQITRQTNAYACQTIDDLTQRGALPKYLDNWVETTVDEIRRLFGMLIFMSLAYRAHLDEYWTTGLLRMPTFRALMTQNRFQLLLRFLHFADNSDITPAMSAYEKRIAKIAPVIDYLNNKFSSIYTPERELSLDESLLYWNGRRLSWVECCRSKAARFGIKAFELSEASTGYLLKSTLYAGKDASFVQGASNGLDHKTAKVALELMDGYLDVGHSVVMDNWYNQLSLTRFLKSRGTDVVGTMNRSRAFVPPEIKNANQKRMRDQEQISRHCGDIAITTWKDVELVTVISTSHNHNNNQVQTRRGDKTLMIIPPVAVNAYNKSMSGVGFKDRRLSPFKMEFNSGLKWYTKVFLRLFNTSILNAYIIYHKHPITRVLYHGAFRNSLGEALVKTSAPVTIRHVSLVKRLQGNDHYPAHTAVVEGKETKYERRRCVRCKATGKRQQVNTMCSKCNVALCVGQCYIDYHTLEKL